MDPAEKPPILRRPNRLPRLLGLIGLLLAVICLGAALTGFSRNQEKRPDPTMTGVEAPLERAAQG